MHAACFVAGFGLGLLVLFVVVVLSLGVGARNLSPGTVWDSLLHGGSSEADLIVRQLRVPRTDRRRSWSAPRSASPAR